MRVFVTGASGWIGSAVVPELIGAGHQVLGLARSDASAQRLLAAGAEAHRGDLDDLDSLRAGARDCDGVIHLAYNHDFSRMAQAAQTDRLAIEALGAELSGSDRPLVIPSGTLGLASGRPGTERDMPDAGPGAHPRLVNAQVALGLAAQGVRSSVVRLAPTVHGTGDPGFMAVLVAIARERGVSGYIGDGSNRWNAVHQLDAARLCRLALESAPAGSVLHGVAEEGVAIRDVATVIGRHLGLETAAIAPQDAEEHFGWLAFFLAVDSPASSDLTRELLGWNPTHPGLLEDLEQGHYFGV